MFVTHACDRVALAGKPRQLIMPHQHLPYLPQGSPLMTLFIGSLSVFKPLSSSVLQPAGQRQRARLAPAPAALPLSAPFAVQQRFPARGVRSCAPPGSSGSASDILSSTLPPLQRTRRLSQPARRASLPVRLLPETERHCHGRKPPVSGRAHQRRSGLLQHPLSKSYLVMRK